MLTRRSIIAFLALVPGLGVGLAAGTTSSAAPQSLPPAPRPPHRPDGRFFDVKTLIQERRQAGQAYHQFLDEPSMRMGLYHLRAGEVDGQTPHDTDEVYYVLEGEATFTVGSETRPVKKGDVLFVRANAEHRFTLITKDLTLLVYFDQP